MPQDDEQRRKQAIVRYLAGDKIADICRQMTCAKSWLYKWKVRYLADDPSWTRERSRRPRTPAVKTPDFLEQAIIDLRQTLAQNRGSCGAAAIQQALQQQGIEPVPSHRTIYRILQRHEKERN
jgi:Homeodomain-like domain